MKFCLLPLAAGLLGGCLPAYDNAVTPLTQTDMSGPGDGGGDMPSVTGSGMFVTVKTTSLENEQNVPGPTGHFLNYPQFTSAPADAVGNIRIEIPSTLLGAAMGDYVVLEGMASGGAILRTVVAPIKYGTTAIGAASAPFIHYFLRSDDTALRGQIAKELAAAAKIPSAASIATDFTVGYGALVYTSGGFIRYNGYAVKVTDAGVDSPATGCDPKAQCCVYYTTCSYPNWKNNLLGCNNTTPFLDLAATKAAGEYFTVVCPAKGAPVDQLQGSVTLTQTEPLANLKDNSNTAPPKDFLPLTMPKVPGDGVHLEWWISD